MNKLNKLFAGFAAVAMLAACSNDEPVAPGDNIIPAGEKAYLTVNIQSAGDIYGAGYSRSTTDGGYVYGDEKEHEVANAHFFFFDANGIYVGRTNPNNPTWNGNNGENIEWIGKNVIVLEDLQGNEYPTYMLTVLNLPTFTDENGNTYTPAAGDSYEKVTAALTQFGERGNFVMSTSSYYQGATATDVNHENKFPMLTKLDKSNFSLEPRDANEATPVEVYVERLAGKVTVTTESTLKPTEKGLYEIDATVFGEGNDGNVEGNTKLYVRLEGWTLNALAKNSYISKQLLAGWETTAPFAGWDKPEYFRSFWAKSWVYDQAKFEEGNNLDYFNYIDYNEATKTAYTGEANYNYCNENTNVAANVLKNKLVVPAYTTHVTLAATVCDVDGNGLDLVEYNKVLFTKADYIKYVLSVLQSAGKLDYYVKTIEKVEVQATDELGNPKFNDDGTPVMVEVDKEVYNELPATAYDWDAANNGTGSIYIAAKADAAEALWVKNEAGEYVEVDVAGKTDIEVMNEGLLAYQKDTTKMAKAIAFNGGRMVYNVPIEHFANNGLTAEDEGYYGVVRNHWYKLSIGKIVRVGHGIFNPGTDEVPGEAIIPDEPEDPRYYVSANINILSWKVINQGGIEL